MRTLRMLGAAAALGTILVFVLAVPTRAQVGWRVVMTGLDNPRGLTFARVGGGDRDDPDDRGSDWALYVAEAGKGGTERCAMIRGAMQCVGATGAVSRYYRGHQERVVTGLPSYAPSTPPQSSGVGATGPHDVSFVDGRGYVTIGLGGPLSPVAMRALVGDAFGWIVRFRGDGAWSLDTDVASYEQRANPDGGVPDSNPYGLLEAAGRRIVVDAGGNTLLRVGSRNISTIAVIPSRPQGRATDAVPNSVAVGRDGADYVGELTGAPFVPETANVWRVVPGRDPQVHCSNFNFIIDLDLDRRGNLYVLEHSSAPFPTGVGTLYRVKRDCSRTPVMTGLMNPTSVAIGPDGHAYISNRGTSPGVGEVIRVDLRGEGDRETDDRDQ
jgi:hypothetical protein